jgi:hypothetical protein
LADIRLPAGKAAKEMGILEKSIGAEKAPPGFRTFSMIREHDKNLFL